VEKVHIEEEEQEPASNGITTITTTTKLYEPTAISEKNLNKYISNKKITSNLKESLKYYFCKLVYFTNNKRMEYE
jgi:hypothetical protein